MTDIEAYAQTISGRPRVPYSVALGARRVMTFVWVSLTYLFLLAPLIVLAGASLHGAEHYVSMTFPPENITLKWYFEIPARQINAIGTSVVLALVTAIFAVLLGVPAAFGLARSNIVGKPMISAIFRAPLQIPSIVIGVSFLHLYHAIGQATGFYATGTFLGLAIGHFFHATPYVIGTTVAVLQRFDRTLEEAALSLGANNWKTFRRVTLPVIMPGVYTGALYSFMVSFGDVPISIFLTTHNFMTFPVELFFGLEHDFVPSMLASSTLIIIFSLLVMLLVQRMVGMDQLLKSMGSR